VTLQRRSKTIAISRGEIGKSVYILVILWEGWRYLGAVSGVQRRGKYAASSRHIFSTLQLPSPFELFHYPCFYITQSSIHTCIISPLIRSISRVPKSVQVSLAYDAISTWLSRRYDQVRTTGTIGVLHCIPLILFRSARGGMLVGINYSSSSDL
jgi:hypothetical protein